MAVLQDAAVICEECGQQLKSQTVLEKHAELAHSTVVIQSHDLNCSIHLRAVCELGSGPVSAVFKMRVLSSPRLILPSFIALKCPANATEVSIALRAQSCSGVVRVLFYGEDERGCPVLGMHCFSLTLASRCMKPLTDDTRLSWASTLLDTLRALHACGIIHGDIKPSNILCDHDDSVLICDFDCAAVVDDITFSQCNINRRGFRGTRSFASGSVLDGRSPCFDDDFESLCYTIFWTAGNRWRGRSERPSLKIMTLQDPITRFVYNQWQCFRLENQSDCRLDTDDKCEAGVFNTGSLPEE